MYRGYVKVWRKILDNPIFYNSKMTHLFLVILLECNHTEKEFFFNNQKQICRRGEFITGRKALANKTKISESSIERLLKTLEIEHLIEQQKTNRFRRIKVKNYQKYQDSEQLIGQQMDNRWTTDGQQMDTTNNYKELRRTKKKYTGQELATEKTEIMAYFNKKTKSSYSLLANHCKHGNREQLIQERLKEFSVEQIKKAIDNFASDNWPDRKKFKQPEYLFRDYVTVERFLSPQRQRTLREIFEEEDC